MERSLLQMSIARIYKSKKIKDAISIAQGRQKAAANKHREPLTLNENDGVLLKFPKARLRQMTGKEGH